MLQKWKILICILTKQINKHTLTLFQTKSYKHANVQPNIQTKQVNKQTIKKKQKRTNKLYKKKKTKTLNKLGFKKNTQMKSNKQNKHLNK
jgi:hypothetical protein